MLAKRVFQIRPQLEVVRLFDAMVEQSAGALLISTADERNEFTLVSGRCSTVFCAFKMQFPRNEGLILTLLGQELEKLPNEVEFLFRVIIKV